MIGEIDDLYQTAKETHLPTFIKRLCNKEERQFNYTKS